MKSLSKQEIIALFNDNSNLHKQYKKKGTFLVRSAEPGETVLTIVAGKLETMKTAGLDEVVLRNIEIGSSAETYIIPAETYYKRYSRVIGQNYMIDNIDWDVAEAKGKAIGFMYEGETITFKAPWDEDMICEKGDFIVTPVGGKPDDVYRIEKNTFAQTYTENNEA